VLTVDPPGQVSRTTASWLASTSKPGPAKEGAGDTNTCRIARRREAREIRAAAPAVQDLAGTPPPSRATSWRKSREPRRSLPLYSPLDGGAGRGLHRWPSQVSCFVPSIFASRRSCSSRAGLVGEPLTAARLSALELPTIERLTPMRLGSWLLGSVLARL
jgi:hypothetical protein